MLPGTALNHLGSEGKKSEKKKRNSPCSHGPFNVETSNRIS